MHETLSQNFRGYIDNFFLENGNLRFSGWIVTTHSREEVIYFLDIGHNVALYNYNERQDVYEFYGKDSNYLNCGYDISVPINDVNKEFVFFALVRGHKEIIAKINLNKDTRQIVETFLADEKTDIKIKNRLRPDLIVVDNFYENPDDVRALALEQSYSPDLRYHKGQRTSKKFIAEGTKQIFESLIGRRITNWVDYEYNGIFQFCTAEDPIVYHSDVQNYAAAVYLTPNAPVPTGTSFYRSKSHKNIYKIDVNDKEYPDVFAGGFYDQHNFELVDTVGNVYNRLVLWDAKLIHSATSYFGTKKEDARLFHLFFFDIEE